MLAIRAEADAGPALPSVNNPVLSGDIFSGSIEPAVTGDPNHEAGLRARPINKLSDISPL